MKIFLKKLYKTSRELGIADAPLSSIQFIIYTNMIWMCTYGGYLLHCTSQVIFARPAVSRYWLPTLLIHLGFWAVPLLNHVKKHALSSHLLIIVTNTCVIFTDLLYGSNNLTFLFLFAFLPTSLNVFPFKKNLYVILFYIAVPFIYMLLHVFFYRGFSLAGNEVNLLPIYITSLLFSFTLFVMYAAYMVLNNIAKQKKLNIQSLNLQATIDNLPAAVWSIDNEYGILARNKYYANSILNEFKIESPPAGTRLNEHAVWELLPEMLKKQYAEVLAGKSLGEEVGINNKYFDIRSMPIKDKFGHIMGATFVSIDISQRKKNELALQKAKEKAQLAEKAKSHFLSTMSHELRTPLNGIIGISHILQNEEHTEAQRDYLNTLKNISGHMLGLVNNVLDYSKIEAGKIELTGNRMNLLDLFIKTESTFSSMFHDKGLDFKIDSDNRFRDFDVFFDELRLQQILNNLISNAFKFTRKGGIHLSASIVKQEKDKVTVFFSVADTGIGIAPEKKDRIFESFNQADSETTRQYGGTGLGLSISTNLARIMGSKIYLQSEPGKGSNFYFMLTMPVYNIEKSLAPERKLSFDQLKDINVLIAEDNPVNLAVAKKVIGKWGVNIAEARNGHVAAELARVKRYDLILVDLDMPVMDGKTATKVIRQTGLNAQTPILAFTAAVYENMTEELKQFGFDGYVLKPFDPEQLYVKMLQMIQRTQVKTTLELMA